MKGAILDGPLHTRWARRIESARVVLVRSSVEIPIVERPEALPYLALDQ